MQRHTSCINVILIYYHYDMTSRGLKYILRTLLLCMSAALTMSSCGTSKRVNTNIREIAIAAIKLDMDIALKDNHKLYIEASKWIGTPYRYGGNSRRGTDCSGFTSAIYKNVYKQKLERSAEKQRTKNCKSIFKRNLKEGDLVFFHGGSKRKGATHVGIYLKENKFIHASTSSGVIVSSLKEYYYEKHWLGAGRVE